MLELPVLYGKLYSYDWLLDVVPYGGVYSYSCSNP